MLHVILHRKLKTVTTMSIYFAIVLVEVVFFVVVIRALVRHLDRKDENRAKGSHPAIN